MGTVQKIVETLVKLSDDKKILLTKRFEEHSSWMSNELALIRDLIQKNPRDHESKSTVEAAGTTEITVEGRPSAESMDSSSSAGSRGQKKRKSPEVCEGSMRHSPDLKRNSSEYEELAHAVGLPADLNKLKKEQLLEELQNRGVQCFGMKSLKKDLVDRLREEIIKHATGQASSTDGTTDPLDTDQDGSTSEQPPAVQRSSFMSPASKQPASPTNDNDAGTTSPKAASAVSMDVSHTPPKSEDNESTHASPASPTANDAHYERDTEMMQSPPARSAPSSQSPDREMEVASSPIAMPPAPPAEAPATIPLATSVTKSTNPPPLAANPNPNPVADAPVPTDAKRRESDASTIATSSTYSTVQTSLTTALGLSTAPTPAPTPAPTALSANTPASTTSSTAATTTAPTTAPVVNKKPTNLLGAAGPATFIDTKAADPKPTPKPVIPALERARQAKAVEDAKAVQKKKDLEALQKRKEDLANEKKLAAMKPASSSASTSTKTAVNGAPAAPVKAAPVANPFAAATATADPPAVAATTAADEKKGGIMGIFGFLQAKKQSPVFNPSGAPVTAVSAAATAAIIKPATAPVVAVAVTKPAAPAPAPAPSTTTAPTPATLPVQSVKPAASAPASAPAPAPVSAPIAPPTEDASYEDLLVSPPRPAAPTASESSEPSVVKYWPTPVTPAAPSASTNHPAPTHQAAPVAAPAPLPTQAASSAPQGRSVAVVEEDEREAPMAAAPAPVRAPAPAPAPVTAPAAAPAPAPVHHHQQPDEEEEEEEEEEDQYEMDDPDGSSGDESGTDEESEKDKQKRIPEWARGPLLKDALERQYGLNGHTAVDPDQIFHEVQTCSLEEIFGCREGRSGAYAKRTSSARWDLDSLSLVEKRTYRSQMGYQATAGGASASATAAM